MPVCASSSTAIRTAAKLMARRRILPVSGARRPDTSAYATVFPLRSYAGAGARAITVMGIYPVVSGRDRSAARYFSIRSVTYLPSGSSPYPDGLCWCNSAQRRHSASSQPFNSSMLAKRSRGWKKRPRAVCTWFSTCPFSQPDAGEQAVGSTM